MNEIKETLKLLVLYGVIGFISSFVRTVFKYNTDDKWDWKRFFVRSTIGTILSTMSYHGMPEYIILYGYDYKIWVVFFIGFFGLEIVSFFDKKDISFFIDLFLKRKNDK